jgi:hypothetical protein
MSARIKHQPTAADRHVGIELEFDLPVPPVDEAMLVAHKAAGQDGISVDYEPISYACPMDKWNGYEAAMLFPHAGYESRLEAAVKLIADRGGFVDARCGLHVHLDVRGLNAAERTEACDKIYEAQTALFAMCEPARQHNAECRRVTRKGRYYDKIAFGLSRKYPTIEVRMMEGTLDVSKICSWVDTLHKVIA